MSNDKGKQPVGATKKQISNQKHPNSINQKSKKTPRLNSSMPQQIIKANNKNIEKSKNELKMDVLPQHERKASESVRESGFLGPTLGENKS